MESPVFGGTKGTSVTQQPTGLRDPDMFSVGPTQQNKRFVIINSIYHRMQAFSYKVFETTVLNLTNLTL